MLNMQVHARAYTPGNTAIRKQSALPEWLVFLNTTNAAPAAANACVFDLYQPREIAAQK